MRLIGVRLRCSLRPLRGRDHSLAVLFVVALVDIIKRPDWQRKLAGQENVLWILLESPRRRLHVGLRFLDSSK